MNKYTVLIRIFRGNEILHKSDGTVKNENHIVTLTGDTMEWHNYLNLLQVNGICKAEVEDVLDINGKELKDADEKAEMMKQFDAEIQSKLAKPEVAQTPEQLRIAELERKLEELTSANAANKKSTKEKAE